MTPLVIELAVFMLAACGGGQTSPTRSTVPTSEARVPAPTPHSWWCYTTPATQTGRCFERKGACWVARALMVNSLTDPWEPITECAEQPTAHCFVVQRSGRASEQMCHPTMAMCRDHADLAKNPGVASITACASSDPWVADTEPHWWCVSFLGGEMGSCERFKARCERDRNKAIELERGHPVDVSACASQASAQCFASHMEDGGEALVCTPTVEICHRFAREPELRPVAGATCGTVE